MIEYTSGNILEAKAEALVNTVNCVGVMGKGIALQFKQAYPANFDAYAAACKVGEVQPGRMFITETGSMLPPRYIINFPTKRNWRGKSRLEDIEAGLEALVEAVPRLGIRSIAVPPLGCGNGGLDWADVRPRIEAALGSLPHIWVIVYEPDGAPAPDAMPIAPKNLKMTRARALLLSLFELYRSQDYSLSRLEAQKLAYFLQATGEPMKLNYEKGQYGPYAHNLNHFLQLMEGDYIRGYGDGSQRAEIRVLPEASQAARLFLANDATAQSHLELIRRLIHGFETPYGLELLATVHWVMEEDAVAAQDVETATNIVQSWNSRKKERYRPFHVRQAWQHLQNNALLTTTA